MQAIRTVYLPPTNHRTSRIRATCGAGSLTVAYDHELDLDGNHVRAAISLVNQLNWLDYGEWITGCLPDGSYAHVCKSKYGDLLDNTQKQWHHD